MRFSRPLLLCFSLILLQGCFDEPKHIEQDTDRSKPSLQMQQPPDTQKDKTQ
ncbi:hypothetical protein [Pseudomonas alkylphenolica]|uniref:hypothetical protein n=1 Tax=Pseudomonas alkylphenolica TaxID=237609 RepID=UPI0013E33925|nr:hypothetical protein [Pseudomonas alkylphenolica]